MHPRGSPCRARDLPEGGSNNWRLPDASGLASISIPSVSATGSQLHLWIGTSEQMPWAIPSPAASGHRHPASPKIYKTHLGPRPLDLLGCRGCGEPADDLIHLLPWFREAFLFQDFAHSCPVLSQLLDHLSGKGVHRPLRRVDLDHIFPAGVELVILLLQAGPQRSLHEL